MAEEVRSWELSREDSKMLQGLSVMAMVCLHLFDRDYAGLFQPLVFFRGVPLSFYFGQLSDFCVFGFAFLSGYAHMKLHTRQSYYRNRLKGLLSLFCSYWLIMIVFSLVSILVGDAERMPGSAGKFIMNALALENSYNGAWWYLFSYVVLVLISPVVLKLVNKYNSVLVLVVGFGIYCVGYYIRFKLGYDNWVLRKIGPLGTTFFEYLLGTLAYKHKIFTYISSYWNRVRTPLRIALGGAMVLSLLFVRTAVIRSLFVAPISGFMIMSLFHFWKKPSWVEKLFLFVGDHSTNIWLTHMFFYSVMFENLVYIAKYPLPIYGLMLLITISISIILHFLEKPVQKLIQSL